MDIFVINLAKDIDRRNYITKILYSYTGGNINFIKAVNGKELSSFDVNNQFDTSLAYKRYGRTLNSGEIGCTLSHFKCYETLLKSNLDYVLILEDDVTLLDNLNVIIEYEEFLNTNKPTILFLSGDYWFYSLKKMNLKRSIAHVYDAVGSYAYIINRAAAEKILKKNKRPGNVSDNWSLYRRQGVRLMAAFPYVVDANIENFESSIKQSYWGEIRKNMSLRFRIQSYRNAFIKRLLLYKGCFVSKIRK